MSVAVMAQVWRRLDCTGTELLLAVAIADISDDEGGSIWPSLARLAWKTRQDVRTVRRQLSRFRAVGWLQVVSGLKGGRSTTTHYRINPAWIKGDNLSAFPDRKEVTFTPLSERNPDTGAHKPGHPSTKTRTPVSVNPDTAVSADPSYPSINVLISDAGAREGAPAPNPKTRTRSAEEGFREDFRRRFGRYPPDLPRVEPRRRANPLPTGATDVQPIAQPALETTASCPERVAARPPESGLGAG